MIHSNNAPISTYLISPRAFFSFFLYYQPLSLILTSFLQLLPIKMSYLSPTASLTEINSVLAKFNIPSWQVCPWVVEFNDSQDKTKKKAIFANKLKAANFDKDTVEMLVKESFDGGATISEGLKGMKQSGSVVMISGDFKKDLANTTSLDEKKLHVQLLFLKERKVRYLLLLSLLY